MKATHRIKPGCGYWDCDLCGIGGAFRRVPRDSQGLDFQATSDVFSEKKFGRMIVGKLDNGKKIAVSVSVIDEVKS